MAGKMRDGDLEIQMTYLTRNELYSKKKPYAADFLLDDIIGAERPNHKFDSTTVIVRNVRNADTFALDVNDYLASQNFDDLLVFRHVDSRGERARKTVRRRKHTIHLTDSFLKVDSTPR